MKPSYRKSGDNFMAVIIHDDGRRETTEGPPLATRKDALKFARLEIANRKPPAKHFRFLDMVANTMRAEMHRGLVGMTMFCPSCSNILDCRDSVNIDLYRSRKLIWSKIYCMTCWGTAAETVKRWTACIGWRSTTVRPGSWRSTGRTR